MLCKDTMCKYQSYKYLYDNDTVCPYYYDSIKCKKGKKMEKIEKNQKKEEKIEEICKIIENVEKFGKSTINKLDKLLIYLEKEV